MEREQMLIAEMGRLDAKGLTTRTRHPVVASVARIGKWKLWQLPGLKIAHFELGGKEGEEEG